MAPLSILLLVKIIGTFISVAAPLLILPKAAIDRASRFAPSDGALYRLYGVAVLALLVGYSGGILQVANGEYPVTIVAMGLVSNLGAVLVIALTGRAKQTPASVGFFGLITFGLAVSLAMKGFAISPLW